MLYKKLCYREEHINSPTTRAVLEAFLHQSHRLCNWKNISSARKNTNWQWINHLFWHLATKRIRSILTTRCSAIAERPRCRVHYSFRQIEDWNWETTFYWQYMSVFNHCDIIGKQSYRIRWKRKIRAYAVQDHRHRYKVKARMRLPISD